jgi:hypothetical protein
MEPGIIPRQRASFATTNLSGIQPAMPAQARVLIIETVVPNGLGIYASLAAKCPLSLERMVETLSPYSVLEMANA